MKWWPWRRRARVAEPVSGAPSAVARPSGAWRSLPPLPATLSGGAPLTIPADAPSLLDRLTLPEPAPVHRGGRPGRVLGLVTAVPGPAVREGERAPLPVQRRGGPTDRSGEESPEAAALVPLDADPRAMPARSGEVPESPLTVAAPRWTAPPTAPETPWTPSEFLHRAYAEKDRLLAQSYLETNGEAQPRPHVAAHDLGHGEEGPADTPPAPVSPAPVPSVPAVSSVPEPGFPPPKARRASLAQARRQGLTLGQVPATPPPSAGELPGEYESADSAPDLPAGGAVPPPEAPGGTSPVPARAEVHAPVVAPGVLPEAAVERDAKTEPVVPRSEARQDQRGPDVKPRQEDAPDALPEVAREAPERPGQELPLAHRNAAGPGALPVVRREMALEAGQDMARTAPPEAGREAEREAEREASRETSPELPREVVPEASLAARRDERREVVAEVSRQAGPDASPVAPENTRQDSPAATPGQQVLPVRRAEASPEAAHEAARVAWRDERRDERRDVVAEVSRQAGQDASPVAPDNTWQESPPGQQVPVRWGEASRVAWQELPREVVHGEPRARQTGVRDAGQEVVHGAARREALRDERREVVPGVSRQAGPADRRVPPWQAGPDAPEDTRQEAPQTTPGQQELAVRRREEPRDRTESVRHAAEESWPEIPGNASRERDPAPPQERVVPDTGAANHAADDVVVGAVGDAAIGVADGTADDAVDAVAGGPADGAAGGVAGGAAGGVVDRVSETLPGGAVSVGGPPAVGTYPGPGEPPGVVRLVGPHRGGHTSDGRSPAPARPADAAAPPERGPFEGASRAGLVRVHGPRTVPDAAVRWPGNAVDDVRGRPALVPSARAQFATGNSAPAGESGSDGPGIVEERAPLSVVRPVVLAVGVDVSDVVVRRGRDVTAVSHRLGVRGYTDDDVVYVPDDVGPLDSAAAAPLLAHELTHAAQQRVLGSALPTSGTIAGAQLEQDATEVERWVAGGASGAPPRLVHPVTPAAPQPPATQGGGRRYRVEDVLASFSGTALNRPRLDVNTIFAEFDPVTGESRVPAGAGTAPVLDVSSLFGSEPFDMGDGGTGESGTENGGTGNGGAGADAPGGGNAGGGGTPSGGGREFDEETVAALAEAIADIYADEPPRRWFDLDDVDDFEELAGRIHHELMSRLRLDMVVDRERSGTLLDFG